MDEMADTGKAQRAKDGSGIEGGTGAKEGVGAKNALKGESVVPVLKRKYGQYFGYLIALVWAAYGVISFVAPDIGKVIWGGCHKKFHWDSWAFSIGFHFVFWGEVVRGEIC